MNDLKPKYKVLITGGAGFIGSSVADRLLALGHQVLVLDNYQTGRRTNNASHPGLIVVEGSVADINLVNRVFDEFAPQVVIHAAASYKDPDNWEEDINTNVTGTAHVARASLRKKVNKFIYLQTSLCYGLSPRNLPIHIGDPYFGGGYNGGSSYAVSKTGGELYLQLSGQEFISFRLANVYGPRNLSGPLPTFFHRLTKQLSCTVADTHRDFIYIDDVVNLLEKAVVGPTTSGYFHIAHGKEESVKRLFDLTCKTLTIESPKVTYSVVGLDDVATISLDPQKTENTFRWKPETILEEGVEKTINWYLKNTITETYTHLKNIF